MPKPLNICIITDDRAGENSILHGISEQISRNFDTQVSCLKIKCSNNPKWLRHIASAFIKLGVIPKTFYSYYLSKISIEGELKNVDVLICRNTLSSFIARLYQTRYGRTFTICWHRPSGFPKSAHHFDVVVRYNAKTLTSINPKPSTIFETSPIFPVKITREDMEVSAAQFLKRTQLQSTGVTRWALLLGKGSSKDEYLESDIIGLTDSMRKLSQSQGIRWLVTTCPRTPKTWASTIKKTLSEHIDYLVDYHKNPESVVSPFLGLCDVVCVTEESATMACECLASEKTTIILTTKKSQKKIIRDGYYRQVVTDLIEQDYVLHCVFDDLHLQKKQLKSCNIYNTRMNELEQTLANRISTFSSKRKSNERKN